MAGSASSSSWQPAPPAGAGDPPVAPVVTPVELDPTKTDLWADITRAGLTLLPHQDHVKVYKSYADNRLTLVHTLTLERVKLAPGIDWEVAYDDNGYGGVFDSRHVENGGDPYLMEHLFKQHLCKFLGSSKIGIYDLSGRKPAVIDWATKLQAFTTFDVTCKVGAMAKDHCHRVLQMKVTRGGCIFFWYCNTVYSALQLKSHQGVPSKWTYANVPKWRLSMSQLGFRGCHVIQSRRSVPAGAALDTGSDRDNASQTIPESCMSTLALLQQLFRWSSAKFQQGGLRNPVGQAAALCFAKGLLDSTCSQLSFAIPIWFDAHWKCQWPCLPDVKPDLNVAIVNGKLDLTEWVDLCAGEWLHDLNLASEWLRQVQCTMGDSCSLFSVLQTLAIDPQCLGIYTQILWSSALRVEQVIAHVISNPASSTANMVKAQTLDLLSFLWQPKQLNHELFKYQLSTKAATDVSVSGPHFTLATDKANVCGVNLANTIIALPSNVAFQCHPQVMHIVFLYPKQCEQIGIKHFWPDSDFVPQAVAEGGGAGTQTLRVLCSRPKTQPWVVYMLVLQEFLTIGWCIYRIAGNVTIFNKAWVVYMNFPGTKQNLIYTTHFFFIWSCACAVEMMSYQKHL